MSLTSEASRLFAQSKFGEAESKLDQVLALEPRNSRAKTMLGVIYAHSGRFAKAIPILEEVLSELPDNLDAITWLSLSKNAIRNFPEAITLCERAIQLKSVDPALYNTLGLSLLAIGRPVQASEAFQAAIRLAPNSAPAFHNLGLSLRTLDDSPGALKAFRRAAALDPSNEGNHMQLYRQHVLMVSPDDAVKSLEEASRQIPHSVSIRDALAASYCRAGNKELGERLFKRLLAEHSGYCHSYALWLQEEGRFSESIDLLLKWLEAEPIQGTAYFCLSEAKCFDFPDGSDLISRTTQILKSPRLKKIDRMYLAYALGRGYEHSNNFGAAMAQFDLANELAFQVFNQERRIDPAVVSANYDRLVDFYNSERIATLSKFGSSSSCPIFIVGMIRSGTTLLDQILSHHPKVGSAGEPAFWKLNGPRMTQRWLGEDTTIQDIKRLETEYLELLNSLQPEKPRIIDKQPLNYDELGLIHVVFPKAKIIHVRRNPLDTCLSIYKTHFGGGPNFAYRAENIVFVYREYLRLMDHWRKVIPNDNLLEVDYEHIVREPERVAREILEHIGLEWDDRCLRHGETVSSISSPSRWQARQPIYQTSIERWKKYESWLGKFRELAGIQHPRC